MSARARGNPLALAVLICLYERPMHPYEVATTLRQRHKHESVRLNYGSLYAVVASLEKRGLIEPVETMREGRLPERTVYSLTESGKIETHDWMTELVSTPVKDYPAFEAALSFLPSLPPVDVIALLHERAETLSGGQKRLVEFARVAAAQPRLVILDEPMGGVNPVLGERMSEAIKGFVTAGSTVVIVEHNMKFIEETCDDVVVMDLGHVIAQGPYSSLRDDERVVTAYLGSVDE